MLCAVELYVRVHISHHHRSRSHAGFSTGYERLLRSCEKGGFSGYHIMLMYMLYLVILTYVRSNHHSLKGQLVWKNAVLGVKRGRKGCSSDRPLLMSP